MALRAGSYRVTYAHSFPESSNSSDSQWIGHPKLKLGDVRVTQTPQLVVKPLVVAYLWAGDLVVIDQASTTPFVFFTGEARIFIRTRRADGSWCPGWVTYAPVYKTPLAPTETWFGFEADLESSTNSFGAFQ